MRRIETLVDRKLRKEDGTDIGLGLTGGIPGGYCLEKQFDWRDGTVCYMSKIYVNCLGLKISEIYRVEKR